MREKPERRIISYVEAARKLDIVADVGDED
jgi:hypothetical protein